MRPVVALPDGAVAVSTATAPLLAVGYAVARFTPRPHYEATLLRSTTGALLSTAALCTPLDTTRARLAALP
ncbi:hypothetical protein ACIG5E_26860 [Kitasatospora sp. NPDC053057]|uniref:hypothetical protein n=1 Tax=Kitasatospora sp. NPDC053057 TaxID=3364062 RepID=UPI0037C710E7